MTLKIESRSSKCKQLLSLSQLDIYVSLENKIRLNVYQYHLSRTEPNILEMFLFFLIYSRVTLKQQTKDVAHPSPFAVLSYPFFIRKIYPFTVGSIETESIPVIAL